MLHAKLSVWLIPMVLLAGCGGSGQDEIQQWMTEQRSQTRSTVQPIPAPKTFTPQLYAEESATDPFNRQKLTQALSREAAVSPTSSSLISPELTRRKEPLESFPLDSMAMVGSLTQGGQPVALVRIDKLLYQVRTGNYLGQNYGRVTKIGENEVVLREIVQDAAGEWIERTATLQLLEGSK